MSEWVCVNINDRYAVNRVGEVKNLEANKKLNPSKHINGVQFGFTGWSQKPL